MATNWREDWKKDLLKLAAGILIGGLLVIGFMLLIINGRNFVTAIKPGHDIGYLADQGGAQEGMHVTGRVPYVYDCFANLEDLGGGGVSEYYYALPTADRLLIISVPAGRYEAMERLKEETWQYLETGLLPQAAVAFEGHIEKAKGRLPYLLGEYMSEIGYSQEEIDALGEPLLVEYAADTYDKARIYAPVGMILLASGILLSVLYLFLKRRKAAGAPLP